MLKYTNKSSVQNKILINLSTVRLSWTQWNKNVYYTDLRHSTNVVKIKNIIERLTMKNE
jgi:hypothetical protein